jgi:hypothetical protein
MTNHRADLLTEADNLVNGDRNVSYGDPRDDFQRTAAFWSAYLGIEIRPHDVGALMGLLKLSRIRWSPEKRDSWADLAGYAACGYECVALDEEDEHARQRAEEAPTVYASPFGEVTFTSASVSTEAEPLYVRLHTTDPFTEPACVDPTCETCARVPRGNGADMDPRP